MTRRPPKVIRRGRPARMLSRAGRPPYVPDLAFSGTYAHLYVPDWAFSGTPTLLSKSMSLSLA